MMNLEELKKNRAAVEPIDWEMTPDEAVRLYLEWGNNWSGGNYVIRSKSDFSNYFVVYYWDETPRILLIRRNCEEAREVAGFDLPPGLARAFTEKTGRNKGVYALDGEIRKWLRNELAWD